jgi:hypothetical protein
MDIFPYVSPLKGVDNVLFFKLPGSVLCSRSRLNKGRPLYLPRYRLTITSRILRYDRFGMKVYAITQVSQSSYQSLLQCFLIDAVEEVFS